MKLIRNIILTAAAGLLTISCASTTSPSTPNSVSAVKPYTSDKCIVTGNKLGSMGDPITMIHNNQEVKFCCKPCVKKFKANPDKYLSKL